MGTISLTLPADGETADASDVNNPLNTIVAVINGGIDADNIEAGGVVPNALQSGTGTSWAWQSWSPTFVNWTIGTGGGAGTTAKYIQIGKTVFFYIISTLGTSGQSVGNDAKFSLPVACALISGTPIGNLSATAASTVFMGQVWVGASSTGALIFGTASGSFVGATGTSSSVPATWAAGNNFTATGSYEAA